jgi:adenosylcobinamide kinase/adenosylcobinamide-phosphate guanylyltransferase
MASHLTLILGGARSGKSAHAEHLAASESRPVHFLPTFDPTLCPDDPSMAERIHLHQSRRPIGWTTHEPANSNLPKTIEQLGDSLMLIDCMTLWLSGILSTGDAENALANIDTLCRALAQSPAHILCVSNELGLAPVPSNPLARSFRDLHGIMNQRLAHLAHTVEWVLAGIPVRIKPAR